MAAGGGSSGGMCLSRFRQGRLVDAKNKRMPFIAATRLLVLVPGAIVLNRWAAAGSFDAAVYGAQDIGPIAASADRVLMGHNARDGLRLAGRRRVARRTAARAS